MTLKQFEELKKTEQSKLEILEAILKLLEPLDEESKDWILDRVAED